MAIEDIKTFVFGIITMVLSIVGVAIGQLIENTIPGAIMTDSGAILWINVGLVLLLGGIWKSKTLITVAFILGLAASGIVIPGLIWALVNAPYNGASVASVITIFCFVGTGLVFIILSFITVQKE